MTCGAALTFGAPLSDRYKQMEQGAEMAELMADEIRGLRGQLRSAP